MYYNIIIHINELRMHSFSNISFNILQCLRLRISNKKKNTRQTKSTHSYLNIQYVIRYTVMCCTPLISKLIILLLIVRYELNCNIVELHTPYTTTQKFGHKVQNRISRLSLLQSTMISLSRVSIRTYSFFFSSCFHD